MKLDAFKQEVFSTGTESSQYGMEMNGTAVAILSDNLYQHKIAAIVRELSSNAGDSHIDAGKADVPIKVILPNEFNPNFVIEDFGLGLTDEEVRLIFACYFKSTKQDSNDVTGAFGLGSKSPFSYTSSFTIQSRKDGVETTYTSMMGEDWIPELRKLFSRETDEGNGVKVTIPVKREDFKRFYDEARAIYSFMSVPVHVTNSDFEVYVDDVYDQIEEHEIALMPLSTPSNLYSHNAVYALMGGVAYPLPYEFSNIDGFNVAFGVGVYNNKSVLVPFDVGELHPAASRETLSMNDQTREKVKNKITSLIDSKLKSMRDEIAKCDNVFDAIRVIDHLHPMEYKLFSYKGKNLNNWYHKRVTIPYGEQTFSLFSIQYRSGGNFCSSAYKSYGNKIHLNSIGVFDNEDSGRSLYGFYRDDNTKTGLTAKCRRYARDNFKQGDNCIIVHKDGITETQLNRINKLFDNKIQWVPFSKVKESQKSNAPRKVGVRGELSEKGDDTINAVYWTVRGKRKADNVKIDDDSVFLSVTRTNSTDNVRVGKFEQYGGQCLAWILTQYYNKDVVLLGENKANVKKMDRLGIKHVTEDLVDDAIKYCSDGIALTAMKMYSRVSVNSNGEVTFCDSALRKMYESGTECSVALMDKVKELVDRVEEKHDDQRVPMHVATEFMRKIENPLLEEIDKVASRYSVVRSSFVHGSSQLIRSEDILAKMVAFCEKNGYTIEEAIKEEEGK